MEREQLTPREKALRTAITVFILYVHTSFMLIEFRFDFGKVGVIISAFIFLICVYAFILNMGTRILIKTDSVTVTLLLLLTYLSIYYAISGDYSTIFIYIGLFLVYLIFNNTSVDFNKVFPINLFIIIELFFCAGVFLQYFNQSLYNSTYLLLFKSSCIFTILKFEANGFCNGFTHQTGFTATYMVYGIGLILYGKERKNFLHYVLLVLFYVALFFTGKRTLLFIAIVVPFALYCLIGKGKSQRISRLFIFALLLFVGYKAIMLFSDQLISLGGGVKRIVTILVANDKASLMSQRNIIWADAINTFRQYPLFGVGIGNFALKYSSTGEAAHNSYLQMLCEGGIIMFLLFVLTIMLTFIRTKKIRAKSNAEVPLKISFFFQLLFIINSFTENTMISNCSDFGIYLIAFCLALTIKKNKSILED